MRRMETAEECRIQCQGYSHDFCCGEFCEWLAIQRAKATASEHYPCKARSGNTGANYPQDCDWPLCGCDPHADKVIDTLNEGGFYIVPGEPNAEMVRAAFYVKHGDGISHDTDDENYIRIYKAMVERSQKP